MPSPDRRSPIRCTTCSGSGILTEPYMWSSDGLRDVGACPDCHDGIRSCKHCGEEEAVGLSTDGDACCWPCWQQDRREQTGIDARLADKQRSVNACKTTLQGAGA